MFAITYLCARNSVTCSPSKIKTKHFSHEACAIQIIFFLLNGFLTATSTGPKFQNVRKFNSTGLLLLAYYINKTPSWHVFRFFFFFCLLDWGNYRVQFSCVNWWEDSGSSWLLIDKLRATSHYDVSWWKSSTNPTFNKQISEMRLITESVGGWFFFHFS